MIRALRAGFATIVALMMMCAVFSPSHLRRHDPSAQNVPSATPRDGDTSAFLDDEQKEGEDEGVGTVDLYGNDVTDAVAKYSLDAAGTLYEVHSPQTEIPRLRPPRT